MFHWSDSEIVFESWDEGAISLLKWCDYCSFVFQRRIYLVTSCFKPITSFFYKFQKYIDVQFYNSQCPVRHQTPFYLTTITESFHEILKLRQIYKILT